MKLGIRTKEEILDTLNLLFQYPPEVVDQLSYMRGIYDIARELGMEEDLKNCLKES